MVNFLGDALDELSNAPSTLRDLAVQALSPGAGRPNNNIRYSPEATVQAYQTAAIPAETVSDFLRRQTPELPLLGDYPGRVLGGTARGLLDPGTLATIPFGGEGIAPSILGRGNLPVSKYLLSLLATTAAGAAGSEAARSAGAPDLAVMASGLAAGGAAGLLTNHALHAQTSSIIDSENTQRPRGTFADGGGNGFAQYAETPFQRTKDGKFLVARPSLDDQIAGRQSHSAWLSSNPEEALAQSATPEYQKQFADNTTALTSVRDFMAENGMGQIAVSDPYAFGRQLTEYNQARSAQGTLTVEAAAATSKANQAQQWTDYLESQVSKPAFQTAKTALASATEAEKTAVTGLLEQTEPGLRTSLRNYRSALINGDMDKAATYARRLQTMPNWETLDSAVQDSLALHSATGEAKSALDALGPEVSARRPAGAAPEMSQSTLTLLNNRNNIEREVSTLHDRLAGLQTQAQSLHDQLAQSVTPDELGLLHSGDPAALGQVKPEVLDSLQQLSQVNQDIAGLQSELQTRQSSLDLLDSQMLQSQETGRALTARLAADALDKTTRLAQASADYQSTLAETMKHLGTPDPGSLAAETIRRHQAVQDYIIGQLQKTAQAKTVSEEDLTAALKAYEEPMRNWLPRSFTDRFDPYMSSLAAEAPNMTARQWLFRYMTPWQQAEGNIDPWATRTGPLGWVRRRIGGAVIRTPEAEGWFNTAHGQRSVANMDAAITYSSLNHNFEQVVGSALEEAAKGNGPSATLAQSLLDQNPGKRVQSYLRQANYTAKQRPWKNLLASVKGLPDTHALSEDELNLIREQVAGNPLIMALHPELVDFKKLSPDVRQVMNVYKSGFQNLQRLAKQEGVDTNGLLNGLLRPEFRDTLGARGELLAPVGSPESFIKLAPSERTILTDYAEIVRRLENHSADTRGWQLAHNSIGAAASDTPLTLDQVLVSGPEASSAIAGQLFNKLGQQPMWDKAAEVFLKDPKDIGKLQSFADTDAAIFKNRQLHDDWQVIKDVMDSAKPTGLYRYIDKAADGMGMLVGSILGFDASLSTVQAGSFAMAHPQGFANIVRGKVGNILSDEGFHTYFSDAQNKEILLRGLERGLGVGAGSIKGGDSTFHNIWEYVPGLRGVGRFGRRFDDIAFERGLAVMKTEAVKAALDDIQLLRAAPQDIASRMVKAIPGLGDIHSQADLWNTTHQQQFDAVLRVTNNQLGSLPRTQMAQGAARNAAERIFLMVPGYFRGRAGLINQTIRAVRSGDVEGRLAASILAREMGAAMTISGTLAALTGHMDDWYENSTDPRKGGKFLSIPVGNGGYIPVLPTTGALRLYAEILGGTGSQSFVGQAKNPQLAVLDRAKALSDFMRGRENPIMSQVIQQVEGRDFFGRQLDTPQARLANAANVVLPLFAGGTIQEGVESARTGQFDPKDLAAQTAAQFFGRNYVPPSPSRQLDSAFHDWQQRNFPGQPVLDWGQAPSDLKKAARQDGTISALEGQAQAEQARRASANDQSIDLAFREAQDRTAHLDTLLAQQTAQATSGQISYAQWKERYSDIQQQKAESSQVLQQSLSNLGFDLNARAADKTQKLIGGNTPQLALALAQYRAINPQSPDFRKDGTYQTESGPVLSQDIDWQKYRAAQQQVLSQFPASVQAQLKGMIAPTDPLAQRYQTAQGVLTQYFDNTPKYRNLSVDQGKYVDFIIGSISQMDQAARAAGYQADPATLYRAGIASLQKNGQIQNPQQLQLAALALRFLEDPQAKLQARNPQGIQLLLQNPETFQFYPWLTGEVPQQLRRLLPQGTGTRSTQEVQQRVLGTTPLEAIR